MKVCVRTLPTCSVIFANTLPHSASLSCALLAPDGPAPALPPSSACATLPAARAGLVAPLGVSFLREARRGLFDVSPWMPARRTLAGAAAAAVPADSSRAPVCMTAGEAICRANAPAQHRARVAGCTSSVGLTVLPSQGACIIGYESMCIGALELSGLQFGVQPTS